MFDENLIEWRNSNLSIKKKKKEDTFLFLPKDWIF